MPLAEVGAEFLFQVVAERTEKAAVVLTTNLRFSEWTQVIPNARLCKALLDRGPCQRKRTTTFETVVPHNRLNQARRGSPLLRN
ncbi:MAG: ATP-binding protein [Acidobacteriota bacterium]|nr:ATP-binding protein [Acidobacteriota bacterium]